MVKCSSVFAVVLGATGQVGVLGRGHGYISSRENLPRQPVVGDAVAAEMLVREEHLPQEFDWRNVNGKNLVAADWNQHIPEYCGGCWIHGTLSPLNDRIKIMRGGAFPDVILGRQSILNCVPAYDGNASSPPPGCNGGDSWMIHKYMHHTKVPDETCMPYQAHNMGCQADTVCRNCLPEETGLGCWPVKNWIGYGVRSYGTVKGEKAMMKEIYARGPIACSFATNMAFLLNYTENALLHEGVYVDHNNSLTADDIDHVMEIAGWGETASGRKYWIIRNSWGTYWGSAGWAKLQRGVNMLLSESSCDWAVPTFHDLDEALIGKVMGDYVRGINQVEWPRGFAAVPVVSMASVPVPSSMPALSAQTFLVFAGTFASGIGATLLAVRMSGRADVRVQPLLG